jgi:hypothetical protein
MISLFTSAVLPPSKMTRLKVTFVFVNGLSVGTTKLKVGPGVYSDPDRLRIAELGLRAELAGGTFPEDSASL